MLKRFAAALQNRMSWRTLAQFPNWNELARSNSEVERQRPSASCAGARRGLPLLRAALRFTRYRHW